MGVDEQRLIAGRYLLVERLGSGGMGTVWRATDRLLRRTVAVKEVHLLAQGEGLDRRSRRAHREARTIARISHPNVVDIYDLVDYENRLWMVMELVDGPSLADVEPGSMTPARVAEIGLQLLAALDAVHAVGALHRDVKPANILLRSDGRVVLCDFGIVALTDTESLTRSDALVGSLAYIAPERLSDQPVGPPSDLFSLGCALYSLLTGDSPFARPVAVAVLYAVIHEQPDIPRNAGPLGPLLEALLRKNPAERPSVAEAAAMLMPATTAATVPHFNGTSRPAARVGPRRHRLLRWTAIPAVVVLVSVAALLLSRSLAGGPTEPGRGGPTGQETERRPTQSNPAPPAQLALIDAVMPTPDDSNQFWIFSGSEYRRVEASADGGPIHRQMIPPSPLASWVNTFKDLPGFQDKIDAVMPIPGQDNQYWVFSGDQYIQIELTDGPAYDDTLLTEPAPLDDWASTFGNLADDIDAVMPTPDEPNQFWVFFGDQYIQIRLNGDGIDGDVVTGLSPLANWNTFKDLPGFEDKIDAVMPIPGQDNQYWVFSGDQYIQIELTDGPAYDDTLLAEPRTLPN